MNIPDEKGDGAAYLAALKGYSGPHSAAAAAPARAPESPPPAETQTGAAAPAPSIGPQPAMRELRRSPRYKCKGSARMQEIGTQIAAWATFSDISIHGCYVETGAPYSVGTRIDLKLEANGFHVEATGEVRISYPQLGMGISFSRMPEADRDRLRELVRSISQPSVILSPRIPARTPSPPSSQSDGLSAVPNPGATLAAIVKFFENRHVMGREEFLRILRLSGNAKP